MKHIVKTAPVLLAAILSIAGCSVGMAPAGMSRDEARQALERMSPQDQIRYYASGPMPMDKKLEKYAEIEKKYGVKASDVLGPSVNTGGH